MFSFFCQNTYKTNKDPKQRTRQLPKMHHMEPKNTTKNKQPKHDQLNPHWTLYYSKCSYDCKSGCHVKHAILLYWGFYSHMLMRGFQCASLHPVLNIGNEAYMYIYICNSFWASTVLKSSNYCELGTSTYEESQAHVDMEFLATIKILMFASSGWKVGHRITHAMD